MEPPGAGGLTHQKPNGAGPQVLRADLNCAESNSSATIGNRNVALGVALDETEAEGIKVLVAATGTATVAPLLQATHTVPIACQ